MNSYDSVPHYFFIAATGLLPLKVRSFRRYIYQTSLKTRRGTMVLILFSDLKRKKEVLLSSAKWKGLYSVYASCCGLNFLVRTRC